MLFSLLIGTIWLMNSFSCSIFPKCPGCQLQQGVRYPPIWTEIQEFFRKASPELSPSLISLELTGWRSKAKLAVRGSPKAPVIGLFERGTHLVVKMEECPLHHKALDKALSEVYSLMIEYSIEPYIEKNATGRLRYIQMHLQEKTGKVQLCLVFNGKDLKKNEKEFLEALKKMDLWHSVWINFFPEASNTILGGEFSFFYGEEDFIQEIKGIPFHFHPSSFAQANLSVFSRMLEEVDSIVSSGRSLLELYAGVGCIGLFLAQKSTSVTLVESSSVSKAMFEKTLLKLSQKKKDNVSFLQMPVEQLPLIEKVDTIIVDPPRKGLSRICKEKIEASSAKQLIYVSCGPLSFMRDAKELLEAGWVLESAKGFLLFPGSDQVELVCGFCRK